MASLCIHDYLFLKSLTKIQCSKYVEITRPAHPMNSLKVKHNSGSIQLWGILVIRHKENNFGRDWLPFQQDNEPTHSQSY